MSSSKNNSAEKPRKIINDGYSIPPKQVRKPEPQEKPTQTTPAKDKK